VLACLDDDVPTDLAERDASGEIPVSQPAAASCIGAANCPLT